MSNEKLTELRSGVEYIDAELRNIHESAGDEPLDDDTQARFDAGLAERDAIEAKAAKLEERMAAAERIGQRPAAVENGDGARDAGFQIRTDRNPWEGLEEVRTNPDAHARGTELRGRAQKAIESARYADDSHRESAGRLVEQGDSDGARAQHILDHSSPEYVEAFHRSMRLGRVDTTGLSARAAMSLTGANGGLAVPQHLDPSIILTNSGATDPFRGISTVKTIAVDQWDGLSSAGVTAEWIAEATEVADASPTFTGPTITPAKADAYIQGSLEVVADSALSGELSMLISDAKFRLEATAHAVGSGSNQPVGIVTALGLTTASRVAGSSGAAGAADLVAADIYALDNDLGDRYRANAHFVGNKVTWNTVRQFGTANNYHAFWTDFGGGLPSQLIGYPVHSASAMDSTIVSGSNDDVIVLGDFKAGYYIVDRMGLELVYNPLVLGSNRRPTGEVGWVAFWRTGADSVNDDAFRMLRL